LEHEDDEEEHRVNARVDVEMLETLWVGHIICNSIGEVAEVENAGPEPDDHHDRVADNHWKLESHRREDSAHRNQEVDGCLLPSNHDADRPVVGDDHPGSQCHSRDVVGEVFVEVWPVSLCQNLEKVRQEASEEGEAKQVYFGWTGREWQVSDASFESSVAKQVPGHPICLVESHVAPDKMYSVNRNFGD